MSIISNSLCKINMPERASCKIQKNGYFQSSMTSSKTMRSFSRIIQQAEEMISSSNDKTQYDPKLRALLMRAERTKLMTKCLLEHMIAHVGPRHNSEMNCLEEMGLGMHQAGRTVQITASTFGMRLVKVGEVEERLGRMEKEYALAVYNKFVDPMEMYLRIESKSIDKEKSKLEKRRLDLDVNRKRQKHATSNDQRILSCHLVKQAQADFERQGEVLEMVLERVARNHDKHLNYLRDFIHLQAEYFRKCSQIVSNLRRELTTNDVTEDTRL